MLPNVCLSMADIKNLDLLACSCHNGISLDSARFMMSRPAIQRICMAGLPEQIVNLAPIAGRGEGSTEITPRFTRPSYSHYNRIVGYGISSGI